ncbi:MAG: 5-methyltetrahydropteroyltriglutamate--homocysteine methyltransferase [Rhizobiales bacterium NRL2]|mgnify:CR=1 FL=1|jgi:5-methyltetrahydropteroyltriglutamate--homocysteine methyltransferase|nr:MAG: 5-methyltetrahydropteroyltriglutamate--homocysteine methyltransferase [Rhizobiales bacterium NRL2]
MFDRLIPTMLVGSYPQPAWLVDRDALLGSAPPRVRMAQVWQPSADVLEEAQDDATLIALRDQERAGIDVLGDGEVRRESYFNHFANALDGIDIDNPGTVPGRTGKPTQVPRVVGPIRRTRPVQAREVAFLRGQTDKPIKITLPGAFTMAKMARDEHYSDQEELIAAYADVLNAEIRDLKAAGADVIQLDEPHMQAHPEEARRFGVAAIDRALDGIEGPTVVHVCFGYAYVVKDKPSGYSFLAELDACSAGAISIEAAQPKLDPAIVERLPSKRIVYGVLDLGDEAIETPETVAERLRGALAHLPAERLIAAPDCGMKYLARDVAFGKLKALAEGAAIVRREVAGV